MRRTPAPLPRLLRWLRGSGTVSPLKRAVRFPLTARPPFQVVFVGPESLPRGRRVCMGQANCRHRHRHASDQVIELHSSPTSHRDHDPLEQLERADFAPLPRHLLYRRDGVDPSAKTARKPEWAPPGPPTPHGAVCRSDESSNSRAGGSRRDANGPKRREATTHAATWASNARRGLHMSPRDRGKAGSCEAARPHRACRACAGRPVEGATSRHRMLRPWV